jgi:NRPS condensation-like uncharacterized protein
MKKIYKRKLDDQAKIFSLSFNKKDTSIFRLSVTLKQNIDEKILQNSLIKSLVKYKDFKVKLKRGILWYYLEENDNDPIIFKEQDYTFKKINTEDNNDYLFKITYFKNKISVDFFHLLTDGGSGRDFFKEIIYNYLNLRYPNSIKIDNIEKNIVLEAENSYTKSYPKRFKKTPSIPNAYQLKGKIIKNGKIGINQFNIKLQELKNIAKQKGCTISIFLTSMIAYSLYETNYKKDKSKKPINISIPVDLKKYYPSKTISNFISHIMVSIKIKKNKKYSFDDIISIVKKEFDIKLNSEKITSTMASDGKAINNSLLHIVPLEIKRLGGLIGAYLIKKQFTLTLSNIGNTNIDNKYTKFIKSNSFIIPPDWAERIRCGVCSYKDKLVVSFSSNIIENNFEKKFKSLLEELSISHKIESNGINSLA